MDITLTTTAAQDTILERLRLKTNAERAAQEPPLAPLVDVKALVVSILTNAVQSYRQQQIAEDLAAVGAVYEAGTNAQRTAIRTAAGL
jgi:hypothetical protein